MGPAEMRRTRIQQRQRQTATLQMGARQPCFINVLCPAVFLLCSALLCRAAPVLRCGCCFASEAARYSINILTGDGGCTRTGRAWGPETADRPTRGTCKAAKAHSCKAPARLSPTSSRPATGPRKYRVGSPAAAVRLATWAYKATARLMTRGSWAGWPLRGYGSSNKW